MSSRDASSRSPLHAARVPARAGPGRSRDRTFFLGEGGARRRGEPRAPAARLGRPPRQAADAWRARHAARRPHGASARTARDSGGAGDHRRARLAPRPDTRARRRSHRLRDRRTLGRPHASGPVRNGGRRAPARAPQEPSREGRRTRASRPATPRRAPRRRTRRRGSSSSTPGSSNGSQSRRPPSPCRRFRATSGVSSGPRSASSGCHTSGVGRATARRRRSA